jgi:hypothetical protein
LLFSGERPLWIQHKMRKAFLRRLSLHNLWVSSAENKSPRFVTDVLILGCPVAGTQRERLKRACNFWLEGESARDVKAPADFYERMRDICLLADTANEEALTIALRMFDDLLLEIDPPPAWYEYTKRWKD